VISVANHKGGTGKTTTTMNLGAGLAILGKKVLLIDIDPQFNLTQYCGLEEDGISDSILETFTENKPLPITRVDENLDLVPSELALTRAETSIASNITSYMKLKNALQPVKNMYDYILIDCPPSLSFFTTNAVMASDSIIIPLETEHLARKGLKSIIEYIDEIRQNGLNSEIELMGILLTKTNHTVISRTTADFVNRKYAKNTFKTVIRDNVTLAESSAGAENIHKYSPRSYGAEDYLTLAKEVIQYG
jgi:chromosome partitioning protein